MRLPPVDQHPSRLCAGSIFRHRHIQPVPLQWTVIGNPQPPQTARPWSRAGPSRAAGSVRNQVAAGRLLPHREPFLPADMALALPRLENVPALPDRPPRTAGLDAALASVGIGAAHRRIGGDAVHPLMPRRPPFHRAGCRREGMSSPASRGGAVAWRAGPACRKRAKTVATAA